MCGVPLQCPLCCNESFASLDALKDHLLYISQNIVCKICEFQYETIASFAEHLGNECNDNVFANIGPDDTIQENDPSAIVNNDSVSDSNTEDSLNIVYKEENTFEQSDEDVSEVQKEEVFHCSTCNMNFVSLDDHIETFHKDHEVFIEEPENIDELDENSQDGTTGPSTIQDSNKIENEDDIESQIECTAIIKSNSVENLSEIIASSNKNIHLEKFWKGDREEPIIKEICLIKENNEGAESNLKMTKVFQCPSCPLYYYTVSGYNQHKCNDEKCIFCDSTFRSKKSLKAHMRVHKNLQVKTADGVVKDEEQQERNRAQMLTCVTCNTSFSSFKSLKLHLRMHYPVKEKEVDSPVSYVLKPGENRIVTGEKFTCEVCNKTYDKEYEEVHRRSHNLEENFTCSTCNRKFYSAANLAMHVRVHVNGKNFCCSYCKKAFHTYESMNDHLTNQCHKRQYECQYCGRRFSKPHEKVKHERIHTGEKPHVCQVCGKSFRVSYCLTLHMRTHSGTRPYQCSHCGKRFKSHSVFNHHMMTHSDERKYKCPFCPKAFKTSVQLAGHKNSHTKPFSCSECNRPFSSLYAVRMHMATHQVQNNLKYKCEVCGASYARMFAYRDHVLEQHGIMFMEGKGEEEETESFAYVEMEEQQEVVDMVVVEEANTSEN